MSAVCMNRICLVSRLQMCNAVLIIDELSSHMMPLTTPSTMS